MRIQCPCCARRFDVPIRTVLAEAARIAEHRQRGRKLPGPDVDGNVLDPSDARARDERNAAVKRRMK